MNVLSKKATPQYIKNNFEYFTKTTRKIYNETKEVYELYTDCIDVVGLDTVDLYMMSYNEWIDGFIYEQYKNAEEIYEIYNQYKDLI